MELPFHLRALPPEALDVLRFFARMDEPVAHASYIMEEVSLSERAFGKVVRRLVTKGYLQMAGDQVYRLTDFGASSVEELSAYDEVSPPDDDDAHLRREPTEHRIRRRLVLALPDALVAGRAAGLQVGFNHTDEVVPAKSDIVVRLSILNGDPARPQERSFDLESGAAYETFQVTPGRYRQVRLRVQVFQLGPNPDDIAVAGGMYVDVPVMPRQLQAGDHRIAFGADVFVTV